MRLFDLWYNSVNYLESTNTKHIVITKHATFFVTSNSKSFPRKPRSEQENKLSVYAQAEQRDKF